ncbi:hypothetical protein [Komagataeibacter xylinus]|nr:hypothetical protein [Komagataeibacter xylinus]
MTESSPRQACRGDSHIRACTTRTGALAIGWQGSGSVVASGPAHGQL